MCWSSAARAVLLIAAACAASCSRGRELEYRRIAVFRFEDLSRTAVPGRGRALAELAALSLSGTPRTSSLAVDRISEAEAFGPTHELHGYFDETGAHAVLQDAARHSTVLSVSAQGSGDARIAFEISRGIDAAARRLDVSDAAARLFGEGKFEEAAAESPQFGPAYTGWANVALARGDRGGAGKALEAARRAGDAILPLEKCRLELAAAALAGDGARRREALTALAKIDPANPAAFVALAELDTASRSFESASAWYREALIRVPAAAVYNAAAYNSAYEGKLEEAVAYLEAYRKLRPRDANPLDSLGEVHYYLGHFEEAERYFLECDARNPAFMGGAAIYKAAWARLMMGDSKRAEEHARAFFARRGDPAGILLRAQWLYVTGRREEANAALVKAPAAGADAHRAAWAIQEQDCARARKALAGPARESAVGAVFRIACGESVPGAPERLRDLGEGLAAMLAGRASEAVARLRNHYRATPPSSPEPAPVLLAWALVESGDTKGAKPLLEHNTVPDGLTDHPLLALAYPRVLELRKRAGVK